MVKPIIKDSTKLTKTGKENVCWGELVIYEFPNILGDNPQCSGSPLTIAWEHTERMSEDIDRYEFLRTIHPRRTRKEMVMKGPERDAYLLGLGYKLSELMKVSEEGHKIRESRRANNKETNMEKFMMFFKAKEVQGRRTTSKPVVKAAKSA